MTDYEVAKSIVLTLLTRVGEVIAYESWSSDFCTNQIREAPDKVKSASWFKSINPHHMGKEELLSLGFKLWNDSGLLLIPVWILPFLEDGIKCVDIFDEQFTLDLSNVDNDHRYGSLSFGIIK